MLEGDSLSTMKTLSLLALLILKTLFSGTMKPRQSPPIIVLRAIVLLPILSGVKSARLKSLFLSFIKARPLKV